VVRGTRSGVGFEHPELLCYFIEWLIGQSSGNATIDMSGRIWDNIVATGARSLCRDFKSWLLYTTVAWSPTNLV